MQEGWGGCGGTAVEHQRIITICEAIRLHTHSYTLSGLLVRLIRSWSLTHPMITRPPRVVMLSPMRSHRLVRNDVVVLLEGTPDCRGEPTGGTEDLRKVHVFQVRLRVAPGIVRRTVVCLSSTKGFRLKSSSLA